jgi:hypothetical protein
VAQARRDAGVTGRAAVRRHPYLAALAVYVGGALAVGVLIGSLNLPRYSRLEAHGADATAVVTATTCQDHQTFAYAFRVAETTYTGRGGAGYGNPACPALRPGDRVRVRYLVADPGQSLPGDIDARLGREWQRVALGAFFLPLAAVLIVRRRRRRGAA